MCFQFFVFFHVRGPGSGYGYIFGLDSYWPGRKFNRNGHRLLTTLVKLLTGLVKVLTGLVTILTGMIKLLTGPVKRQAGQRFDP